MYPSRSFEEVYNVQSQAIERLKKELSEARAECLEQARLNGMGSEREAKLLAEIEILRKTIERLELSMEIRTACLRERKG